MRRIAIVVFAQVPPPEHGQSRMVQLALDSLRDSPEGFDVHHVNARFSESLEDIGESSLYKAVPVARYLLRAVRLRFRLEDPLLYYVPGPAKWSAVIRDWVLLGVLRIFYRKTVFHWHAIGHGEWAHGSERLNLGDPNWVNRLARRLSRLVLDRPFASICVSPTSRSDSLAVSSINEFTVCNGIEDPCPDYGSKLGPVRMAEFAELAASATPHFRVLFLSHGTEEKGLFDAIDALRKATETSDQNWRFTVTFAGGVSGPLVDRFECAIHDLRRHSGDRLSIRLEGYVSGEDKSRCYRDHDIFLAPSRWESFGLTVVEAMAHGMQVVAIASDGVMGVLSEEHPYLAPPSAPTALCQRLLQCCGDLRSNASEDSGTRLRQRFLENFQLKYFSNNLIEAITALGKGALSEDPVFQSPSARCFSESAREERKKIGEPVFQSPAARCFGETVIEERKSECEATDPFALAETPKHRSTEAPSSSSHLHLSVYLADQNPGFDRSIGISRMTQSVISALKRTGKVWIHTVSSRSSQETPDGSDSRTALPWDTRSKWIRFLTDHLHPLLPRREPAPSVFYFPKGYLPWFSKRSSPSVVTIHDTIIQYDKDHYPSWRSRWEYGYWSWALRHTLRKVDRIMTISESSKDQIESFMVRHRIPRKEIRVTYEPCAYESIPQPEAPEKADFVMHLGSREPHKKTSFLIQRWNEGEQSGRLLPPLQLVGSFPEEVSEQLDSSTNILRRPFLADAALQEAYRSARALILPSEIEGFGLPALEAYYLGTPVCFVKGTSVDEILSIATAKGGFSLDDPESLFHALDEVLSMSAEEIRNCGLKLREIYASEKVAERMVEVFHEVKNLQC